MDNLISCDDCGELVSINAVSCPKCGSMVQKQPHIKAKIVEIKKQQVAQKLKAQREKSKKFWLYFYITLCFIISLIMFQSHWFTAFVFIFAGVFAIPKFKEFMLKINPMIGLGMCSLLSAVLFFIGFFGFTDFLATNTPANNKQNTEKTNSPSNSIYTTTQKKDYSDIVMPYTKKNMPKLYARWGDVWIKKINHMLPLAAAKAAQNPKCDIPEIVDISDQRSIVKKEAVFFVDCKNKERIYVSQKDLETNNIIQAESEKLRDNPADYIEQCRKNIQTELQLPSSFDDETLNTSSRKTPSGKIEILIPFTAKNGIGNELPYMGRCLITTQHQVEVYISNR